MSEKRRRWVNTKYVEADIRQGYNFVYSDSGEIISRPSSDGKRAFLLEKDETKEIEPVKGAKPAHLVIDGQSEHVEDDDGDKTNAKAISGVAQEQGNSLGYGGNSVDGAGVPESDGKRGDI